MNTTLQTVRKNVFATLFLVVPLAALALVVPSSVFADDAATAQQAAAYQKAVQEENLQKEMTSIQAELASMRDEMRKLLPADVAMVDRAFSQINSLSATEIKATIDSLRAASKNGDIKGQLEQLSNAYQNQTQAVIKMKSISGELSARAIRDDITQKLEELLKRQVVDMDEVARLGQVSQAPNGLGGYHDRYTVVLGDQQALTEDLKGTIQSITDAATNLPEDARKFMVAASGIITQQRLPEYAAASVTNTQNGPFAQAVQAQAGVVNTLAMIIHALSSDEKVMQQLQDLSSTLGQLIDDQKGLAATMNNQRGRGNFGRDMMSRQIDLSDKAGAARAELTPLNNQAAGMVQDGQISMERAITILSTQARQQDRQQIAAAQQTAVDDLTAAKKELDQQIAMLEASKAPSTQELIADLTDLLREVQQAALDESRTAQAAQTANSPFMPTAAAQKTFHDHVDDLQKRALPVSPDAAQAIGEASQQLTTAASAAQQPAMATAHVAAAQDLAKAADILAKQLAALNGDTKAEAEIAQAIAKMQDAEKQTDQAKADEAANKDADAANQLAAAQQDVAAAQQAAAAAQADAAAAQAATPADAANAAAANAALAQANAATATAQAAAAQAAQAAPANANAAAAADAAALAALQNEQQAMQADAAAAGDAAAADAAAAAAAGQGEGQGEGAGAGEGAGMGEGQGQGEGEGAGSGAGVGMGPAMDPGQGDAPGQQMNSDQTGQGANGMENTALAMKGGGAGGGTPGALGNFGGTGTGPQTPVQVVSGLTPHDRAAVAQLQNEKPPREYVPEVQQYYKNLGDGSGL